MFFIQDDDFLSDAEYEEIDNLFVDPSRAWRYAKGTVPKKHYKYTTYISEGSFSDIVFFTHHCEKNTEEYNLVTKIINKFAEKHKINYGDITRLRFNITPISETNVITYPHVDTEEPHYIFLYYVNDADGDTVIYDQVYDDNIKHSATNEIMRISPKKGRAFIADGRHFHSISAPIKGNLRTVINANLTIN